MAASGDGAGCCDHLDDEERNQTEVKRRCDAWTTNLFDRSSAQRIPDRAGMETRRNGYPEPSWKEAR